MAEKTPLFQYVHHVHYVVHNLDDVMAYMEQHFNMKPDHMFEDKSRGMRDALYDVGQTHIQITEPAPNSTHSAAKHLAKHGPGVFHVAWGVDGIEQAVKNLASQGVKMQGKDGLTKSPRGYLTSNIEPASSHGVWWQMAEGGQDV